MPLLECFDSDCAVCSPLNVCVECRANLEFRGGVCINPLTIDFSLISDPVMTEPSECLAELPGCAQCTENECLRCLEGFWLSEAVCLSSSCTGSDCSEAIESLSEVCIDTNCARCFDPRICDECLDGFRLLEGKCIDSQTNKLCGAGGCNVCESEDNICGSTLGCLAVTLGFGCTACEEGLILSGAECLSQVCEAANCMLCDGTGDCRECKAGFEPRAGGCAASMCQGSCAECLSNGECVRCLKGFELFHGTCEPWGGECVSKGCKNCGFGCLECGVGLKCLECLPTFFLDKGTCYYPQRELFVSSTSAVTCGSPVCRQGTRRMNDQCIQCQTPCVFSQQKLGGSSFRVTSPRVIFYPSYRRTSGMVQYSSTKSTLLFTFPRPSKRSTAFRLPDDAVEFTTCYLNSYVVFYFTKDDIGPKAEVSTATSAIILEPFTSVLTLFAPTLLGFIQANFLFKLVWIVSATHSDLFDFVGSRTAFKGNLTNVFNLPAPKFQQLQTKLNDSPILYIITDRNRYLFFFLGIFFLISSAITSRINTQQKVIFISHVYEKKLLTFCFQFQATSSILISVNIHNLAADIAMSTMSFRLVSTFRGFILLFMIASNIVVFSGIIFSNIKLVNRPFEPGLSTEEQNKVEYARVEKIILLIDALTNFTACIISVVFFRNFFVVVCCLIVITIIKASVEIRLVSIDDKNFPLTLLVASDIFFFLFLIMQTLNELDLVKDRLLLDLLYGGANLVRILICIFQFQTTLPKNMFNYDFRRLRA